MAGVNVLQSAILASPVLRNSNRARVGQLVSTSYAPKLRKMVHTVRCMAGGENQDLPSAKPKVSTKFSDVLAFSGPAPERINGRLAMVGFVAAIAVEVAKGQDLLTQVSDGGITWFIGTSVLLSLASLIPLFKGINAESKSDGVMTSDAELWNGRFAMLGLVALAFTEFVKGGALV
ncbi:early light-induced protein 1, chloroplastic-like isoform X1 [Mercurialis annua]|uniref:early light-induced protein 1, chloroplastic-like isoform X1 n=1 Tax=Mercurialis annua TaxID=3986 RepID=UPI0024ADD63D|nr:early light-induced protein 1, chloroplastic-like isoform X1 [Mercurialis annua]